MASVVALLLVLVLVLLTVPVAAEWGFEVRTEGKVSPLLRLIMVRARTHYTNDSANLGAILGRLRQVGPKLLPQQLTH